MKSRTLVSLITILTGLALGTACGAKQPEGKVSSNVHSLTVKTIDGKQQKLSDYKGKVLLVVNTASQCGYTRQYKGLQALYAQLQKSGLEVLAFPSNDFGGQEPGTDTEIKQFCETRYRTTFPLFSKVHATGANKSPLYRLLTEGSPKQYQGDVRWNFTKFLVDKDGAVVGRYESSVSPSDAGLVKDIKKYLAAK